jgi:predicted P-loop ATPase
VWDGKERLDGWLATYCGAAPSPVISAFGAKWAISAVARTLRPGAKADCCLILEGPRGRGKSTTFRILGGDWFTDELADVGSKDASLQTRGVWIIGIAELASFNRSEVSRIKSFMSRSTDRFRPPYGKRVVTSPRQCVFGGTSNHDGYLRDETGARRFWSVACGEIDLRGLESDRDQLWAEAVKRYRAGEKLWLDSEYLNGAAGEEQSARYEGDAWDNLIADWVSDRDDVSSDEVLRVCIEKDKSQWTQGDRMVERFDAESHAMNLVE